MGANSRSREPRTPIRTLTSSEALMGWMTRQPERVALGHEWAAQSSPDGRPAHPREAAKRTAALPITRVER